MMLFSVLFSQPECQSDICSQEVQQSLYQKSNYSKLFLSPWYRWDSVNYLEMAENGYQGENTKNTVWPPLYPFLIRVLSHIMPPMQAALLISTLAFLLGLYLLHKKIVEIWNVDLANRTILMISIFPGSMFFMAAYTESLFFCLALSCILSANNKNWVMAGISGALAAMTRQLGVLLIIPVLWEIYQTYFKGKNKQWKNALSSGVFAALIPLQTGLNFGYIHFILEQPWPWETLSNNWNTHYINFPWVGIIDNLKFLITNKLSLMHISMAFDLFFSILFVFLLVVKIPKMPFSYRIYGLFSCILPVLVYQRDVGCLTSIGRYVLPAFPAFIALAYLIKNKYFKMSWLFFSLIGLFLYLICFYKWIWIA